MCPFLSLFLFSMMINCRGTVTSGLHDKTICVLISLTYVEGGQSLTDALLNEVVCDATRGMFIENRVHQCDLGSAASCLGFGGTELEKTGRENMH